MKQIYADEGKADGRGTLRNRLVQGGVIALLLAAAWLVYMPTRESAAPGDKERGRPLGQKPDVQLAAPGATTDVARIATSQVAKDDPVSATVTQAQKTHNAAQATQRGSIDAGQTIERKAIPDFALPEAWKGAKVAEYREPEPPQGLFIREYLLEAEGTPYPIRIHEQYKRDAQGVLTLLQREECVANHVLVKIGPKQDAATFAREMERMGAVVEKDLKNGLYLLKAPVISLDAVPQLRADVEAAVSCEFTEPDYLAHANVTPNDSSYSQLWAMPKISAPAAWDIRRDASSVIVAVIDTGVRYTHADLTANMWQNPGEIAGNGVDDDWNGYIDDIYGIDACNSDSNPVDDAGHGTHCAGTVGAVGNNSRGVVGAAWNVKIMTLKFLSASGSGALSDAIICINYAVANGADLLSNSWGGGPYSSSLNSAITAAKNADIVFVAAAGNSSGDNDSTPTYPASYSQDNIVAVAATTSSDTLASFSCYGSASVDIGAPGVAIYSTSFKGDSSYESMDGTSMATPLVAGCLAILKAQYPQDHYTRLINRLYDGGTAISALSGKVKTGKRVNLLGALQASTGLGAPTGVSATDGTFTNKVQVSWNSVSGASHYQVYRGSSASDTKAALGGWQTATALDDTSAAVASNYYYWVRAATSSSGADVGPYSAYDIGWRRSASSVYPDVWDPGDNAAAGATVLTPAATAQSHGPHGLADNDAYDCFRVSLTAGRNYTFEATGIGDTYGELYNSTTFSATSLVASDDDTGDGSHFRIAYTPSVNETGYLRVRTFTSGNAANYNVVYSYAVPSLPAPASVSASDGAYTDKVYVVWGSVSGATHYRVYRATSVGGTKEALGSGWQTSSYFYDTSALVGQTYVYWVKAAASSAGDGASDYSTPDTGYRKEVSIVTGSVSNVSWSDLVDQDGDGYTQRRKVLFAINLSQAAAVTFRISFKTGSAWSVYYQNTSPLSAPVGDSFWQLENVGSLATLAHGLYDWKVELLEGGRTLGVADAGTALVGQKFETTAEDLPNLPAPTGVGATDGVFGDKVVINWNAVAAATHYQVYRAASEGGTKTEISGWQSSTHYVDTNAIPGTLYYYWVKASASMEGSRASDYSTGVVGSRSTSPSKLHAFRRFGSGPLTTMDIANNGKYFVAGGRAGSFVYDMDGNLLMYLSDPEGEELNDVVFTPDSTLLVAAYAQKTILWDILRGKIVRTWRGSQAVRVSKDGQYVVCASSSKATLYDLDSGVSLAEVDHGASVDAVAISPDNQKIITGAWATDNIKVWSTIDGSLIRTLDQCGTGVDSIDISPCGDKVVATPGNWSDKFFVLWDMASGAMIRKTSTAQEASAARFSPDGQTILVGTRGGATGTGLLNLYSVNSGTLIRSYSAHTHVFSVKFASDGLTIMSGGDGRVIRWNMTGSMIRSYDMLNKKVDVSAFSPDSSEVVLGFTDGTLELWDIASNLRLRTFMAHNGGVSSVSFSPDGTKILSGASYTGSDKTVKIWNKTTGALIRTFNSNNYICEAAYSPDGSKILAGTSGGYASLWSADSGTLLRTFSGHSFDVLSVDFSPDGQRIITGGYDKSVKVWDAANGTVYNTFARSDRVDAVRFSPDGSKILVGGASTALIDLQTGSILRNTYCGWGRVNSLAFSPTGSSYATATSRVHIRNTATGDLEQDLVGHNGNVYCVSFSADHRMVLSGGSGFYGEGTAVLWLYVSAEDFRELAVNNATGSGSYVENEYVSVWANAAPEGFRFSHWSGDTQYVENTMNYVTRVRMPDQDISITSVYVPILRQLTVNGGTGSGQHGVGETVPVVAAVPPAGQLFAVWTGNTEFLADKTAINTTLTMPNADVAITATYRLPVSYTLVVNGGNGSGDYLERTEVAIAASEPPAGERFDKWAGDVGTVAALTNPVTTLIMPSGNSQVSATFTGYGLTVNGGSGGGVYPDGRSVPIVAAAPPNGKEFDRWTGDTGYVADTELAATSVTMPASDIVLAATYRNLPAPDPFGDPVAYPTAAMTILAEIKRYDGLLNSNDTVAVYCGAELRGKSKMSKDGGRFICGLTVCTTADDESLTFRVWDASESLILHSGVVALSEVGGVLGSQPDNLFLIPLVDDPFGLVSAHPSLPMTIEGEVTLFGELASEGDMVAVYRSGDLRGKALVTSAGGHAYVHLQVFAAENGEPLLFKVWDRSEGVVHAIRFVLAESEIGGLRGRYPDDLFPIPVTDHIALTLQLSEGWNQISFNLRPGVADPRSVFGPVLAQMDSVWGPSGTFAPSLPDAANTLKEIELGVGYWVKMNAACTLSSTGLCARLASDSIAVSAGWNHIGYLPEHAGDIREVLADALASGKIRRITGRDGSFEPNYPNQFNTLTTMNPGLGYWLLSSESATFHFQTPGGGVSSAGALMDDALGEVTEYPNPPMTVLVKVHMDGQSAQLGDRVVARVGEELRAKVPVMMIDGETYATLTVQVKENGETVTFHVWKRSDDRVRVCPGVTVSTEVGGLPFSYPDHLLVLDIPVAVVAHAGNDEAVYVGKTVTLEGSGSLNTISYAWTLTARPEGSAAVLSGAGTLRPSLVLDVPGTYTAQLVVSDGVVESEPDMVTVTARWVESKVESAHGQPDPGTGTLHHVWGEFVEYRVSGVETLGATQYVCTGWTGTGSVPSEGGTTNVRFTVTNDSAVVWLWGTNFWLNTQTVGNGSVDISDGWHAAGSNVVITATPATYHHLVGWQGDTSDCLVNGRQISVRMDRARDVTALFRGTCFISDLVRVSEAVGSVTLTVSGGCETGVSSVDLYVQSGMATAGSDYTPPLTQPRRIAWTNAMGERSITIPIKTDGLVEDDETFYVLLGNPSNCILDEQNVCAVIITDSNRSDTLADALDGALLKWMTGGAAEWVPQTAVTCDGEDAAASGAMASNKVSYVSTSVTGTGTLSFAWSVAGRGVLRLYDGKVVLSAATNNTVWESRTFELTQNAAHALKWEFTNLGGTNSFAYLDRVVWLPGNKPGVAVTAVANNPAGGLATGTGVYYAGAAVPLNARPRPGWLFTGWTPADLFAKPLTPAQTLTISNSSVMVTANFAKVPVVTGVPRPPEGGTVSGSGLCLPGKKLTLKAMPAAKWAFTSWSDGLQTASRPITTNSDVTLFADFKLISQIAMPVITNPGTQNAMVGVPFRLSLDIQSESLPKVTVIGLPAGIKYDAAAASIVGIPSAVPKGGTATVKVSTSNPGGKAEATFLIAVDPLPVWATGAFNGIAWRGATGPGSASMSVTVRGAASGKVSLRGTNFTFSAKSFAAPEADGGLRIAAEVKAGKTVLPLDLSVYNPESPAPATLGRAVGGMGDDGFVALYRNVWKDPDLAPLATNYTGYYTATLPGDSECGSGYLTFTVDKRGNVKTAGKLADGTAVSLSGPLILGNDWSVSAFLYAAPATYKGGCLYGTAEFSKQDGGGAVVRSLYGDPVLWQSLAPQATSVYGEGFDRRLGLSGGWYDKLGNLYAYYANRTLTAGTEGTPIPEIVVGTNRYDSVCWDPDGLALTVVTNKLGVMTSLSAPKAGTPVKVGGEWMYDTSTNTVGLTIGLTRATGVFKGSFKAWFDYATTHTSKTITYEGVLTPERENTDDGIAGRGFFLWSDTSFYLSPLGKPVPYSFSWSYDLKILLSE